MSSSDPKVRKSGCAVLGVIAEGCADTIRTIMERILPGLLQSTQDPDQFVREAAFFALGNFQ